MSHAGRKTRQMQDRLAECKNVRKMSGKCQENVRKMSGVRKGKGAIRRFEK
jgi:hypothetical protein